MLWFTVVKYSLQTAQPVQYCSLQLSNSQSVTKEVQIFIHRVSKKLCQLIFSSLSVKYEPISIKIGRIVPEETLNETVPKLPTSPKVCACTTLGNLKCQIEPSTR